MSKPLIRVASRHARESARLLGGMIRSARIARRLTIAEVAERAGVSPGLIHRIERGGMGCSIGAAFEVAAIVGVPLFDADSDALRRELSVVKERLALLPKSARRRATVLKDDF